MRQRGYQGHIQKQAVQARRVHATGRLLPPFVGLGMLLRWGLQPEVHHKFGFRCADCVFGSLLSRRARRSRPSYPPCVALHWRWNQKSILGGLASTTRIPLNAHPPVTAYFTHMQVICSWYRTSMTARSCCRPKCVNSDRPDVESKKVMRDPSWSPTVRSHCGRLMFLR